MNQTAGNYGVTNGVPFISVPKADFSTTPETVRFMQFDGGDSTKVDTAFTTFFGTKDIAVSNVEQDPTVLEIIGFHLHLIWEQMWPYLFWEVMKCP